MLTARGQITDRVLGFRLGRGPTTTSPSRLNPWNFWHAYRRCCGARLHVRPGRTPPSDSEMLLWISAPQRCVATATWSRCPRGNTNCFATSSGSKAPRFRVRICCAKLGLRTQHPDTHSGCARRFAETEVGTRLENSAPFLHDPRPWIPICNRQRMRRLSLKLDCQRTSSLLRGP